MEVVVGKCPKCGCPIYQEDTWAGSGHPPAVYICKCYQDEDEPDALDVKIARSNAIGMGLITADD